MSADQASALVSVLLALLVGFVLMGAGFGFLWSAGSRSKKEGGTGTNAGKVVTILVLGFVVVFWLAQPGAGPAIAGTISAIWASIVAGMQPLVAIATQLAMIAAIGLAAYYLIRHFFRRR